MGNCELCAETNVCVCVNFFNDEWNYTTNQCDNKANDG